MVNEDIITALTNAVNKGESLEIVMQILVNSGYDAREVQEAAQYVGKGAIHSLEPKRDGQLDISKKIEESQFANRQQTQVRGYSQQPARQYPQQLPRLYPNSYQQIPRQTTGIDKTQVIQQNAFSSQTAIRQFPQSSQTRVIESSKSKKKSYVTEIILFITLLILIGVLIATFIFKDDILSFLSGI